jgi:predicted O-methyltransferase YrrM
MKDHKSTLSSLPIPLALGIARNISGRRVFELGHALTNAIKDLAGLPPLSLADLPGEANAGIFSHLQDGAPVAMLAKLLDAKNVFEFGTFTGATTALVASQNPQCRVVTLDLPVADYSQAVALSAVEVTDEYLFQGIGRGECIPPDADVTQLRMDSAKFDPEPWAGIMDLIYIDASHSYSAVRNDTEKALRMLAPNGVIVWDDYYYAGIWRYLNELNRERPDLELRRITRWGKAMTTRGLLSKRSAITNRI